MIALARRDQEEVIRLDKEIDSGFTTACAILTLSFSDGGGVTKWLPAREGRISGGLAVIPQVH